MGITATQQSFIQIEEMVCDIKIGMLVTTSAEGGLHSRPMLAHCENFEGTLWFFTEKESGKVYEVQKKPQVNVCFADPKRHRYLSLTGSATFVKDEAKMREIWTTEDEGWFPRGLDDDQLGLLRVTVSQAEYWDSPSETTVLFSGLLQQLGKGDPPKNQGEHEKVTI